MLDAQIRDSMLVDEKQLGDRLNLDIHNSDRADFALMLAMLSRDITDQPTYVPKDPEPERDEDLRQKFALRPPVKLYAADGDIGGSASLAGRLHSDGIRDVFLCECISPEPMVPFERTFAPEVFASLSPLKQQKLRFEQQGRVLAYEKIRETGDGFDVLDELKQSRAGTAEPQLTAPVSAVA